MDVNIVEHQFLPYRPAGFRGVFPIADNESGRRALGAENDLLNLGASGGECIALLAPLRPGAVPVVPNIAAVHAKIDGALRSLQFPGLQVGVIADPDPRDV